MPVDVDEEAVAAAYESGATCRRIAADAGVDESTVRRILSRHAVPRRPRGSRPRAVDEDGLIAARETDGLTWAEVGARYGMSWSGARRRYRSVLRQRRRREPPRPVRTPTGEEIRALRAAWRTYTVGRGATAARAILVRLHDEEGISWSRLAAALGTAPDRVRAVARSTARPPVEPTRQQQERLRRVWRRYRGGRSASAEVTQVMRELHDDGVALRAMSRTIGVSHRAVWNRLHARRTPRTGDESQAGTCE